jgi:ketosteroid isomerase-like protein
MSNSHHALVRRFFAELGTGNLSDELLADDMTVWSSSSGSTGPAKAKYQFAVRLLQSLFPEKLAYQVVSLTAEEDRVAAEVQARGTLCNGERYENSYVFIFRIRDARIAAIAEHFNVLTVQEKIAPLMADAMAKRPA